MLSRRRDGWGKDRLCDVPTILSFLHRNPRISGCDTDIGAYEVQLASLDAPAIPSGEAGYAKNRYISFDPANGGQFTALRVVLAGWPVFILH